MSESKTQTYPKYRISLWIDTSQEAMNSPDDPTRYGIDIQTEKGGKWRHGHYNGRPVAYKTREEASAAIKHLKEMLG